MLYPTELRAQHQLSDPDITTSGADCQSPDAPNSQSLVSGLFSGRKTDPTVALLVERWPDLHEAIKEHIMAIVREQDNPIR